ncbi:unnamed protein product [Rhizoctonia solani]
MSSTENPLAALLAAKLAEDPGYLQRIIAQAAGLVKPSSKKPKADLEPSRVLSPSNKEETRGDSGSIERTLSNASTAII